MVEPLKLKPKRRCKRCGQSFVVYRPQHLFCTTKCKMDDYNESHDIAGRMRKMRHARARQGAK
jgi:endogenous inhibitor of DNA gyrase (YacG/DUF329 family)